MRCLAREIGIGFREAEHPIFHLRQFVISTLGNGRMWRPPNRKSTRLAIRLQQRKRVSLKSLDSKTIAQSDYCGGSSRLFIATLPTPRLHSSSKCRCQNLHRHSHLSLNRSAPQRRQCQDNRAEGLAEPKTATGDSTRLNLPKDKTHAMARAGCDDRSIKRSPDLYQRFC